MVFLGNCDNKLTVDLIKSDKCNFSVRDSLIFAGYARKQEDSLASKVINEYQNRKVSFFYFLFLPRKPTKLTVIFNFFFLKSCIFKASIDNDKIFSKHYEKNSIFGVKMRHIVNPNEFYVTKVSQIKNLTIFPIIFFLFLF